MPEGLSKPQMNSRTISSSGSGPALFIKLSQEITSPSGSSTAGVGVALPRTRYVPQTAPDTCSEGPVRFERRTWVQAPHLDAKRAPTRMPPTRRAPDQLDETSAAGRLECWAASPNGAPPHCHSCGIPAPELRRTWARHPQRDDTRPSRCTEALAVLLFANSPTKRADREPAGMTTQKKCTRPTQMRQPRTLFTTYVRTATLPQGSGSRRKAIAFLLSRTRQVPEGSWSDPE